jgi:hypothetical protein
MWGEFCTGLAVGEDCRISKKLKGKLSGGAVTVTKWLSRRSILGIGIKNRSLSPSPSYYAYGYIVIFVVFRPEGIRSE